MAYFKVFETTRTKRFLLIFLSMALFLFSSPQLFGATASAACTPDFTLTGSNPQTFAAGARGEVVFTVSSVCGLYGAVGYSISITPTSVYPEGIALHQPTYHPFVISSTHPTGSEAYQVLSTSSTPKTTYTITFTASILGVKHSVSAIVTVNGYTITVSLSTVSAPLGQPVQSMITLTSYGGYSATIYYSISISPNPPAVGTDSCFNPVPGGPTISSTNPTATSQWTCIIMPKGTYTVTITAMPINGVAAPELSTTVTVKVT